jgi:hypothetical protein
VLPANAKVKHLRDAAKPKVAKLFVKEMASECAAQKDAPANIKF